MSISSVDAKKAWELIKAAVKLVDVRTESEFEQGHLSGAINIPHDQLSERVTELNLSKDESVVLYCKSGGRSDFAMKILHQLGFPNAVNAGGYEDLINAK